MEIQKRKKIQDNEFKYQILYNINIPLEERLILLDNFSYNY